MRRTEPPFARELLPPGCRVVCAVSGGADSVCLLDLVRQLPEVECLCAHFDHGIRGEESRRDARFVEELCRRWQIPFYTETGDVPGYARQSGQSLETAARELRYAFLRRVAGKTGADRIATAHNQNDNAETILFRLARGTGLRGLTGIPAERDGIVRPLLSASRAEIEAYLTARGIAWVEDSTNALDDAARNRARHHLLPALEELHAGAAANVARTAENLREDEEYLVSLARERLCAWGGETLPTQELLALPRPVAARVLRLWLGEELTRERTEAVLALCRAASPSAWTMAAGRRVCRRYGELVLSAGERPPLIERTIELGQRVELPELGLAAIWEKMPSGAKIQSSFTTFDFSCVNICDTLSLTRRREGDALAGRSGRRSLKKRLIDAHVPREERDRIPVVRQGDEILAVYGLGQAEGTRPRPGEEFTRLRFEKTGRISEINNHFGGTAEDEYEG